MISFLNGVVVEKQPTRLVVDVGGVGYEVFIPLSSYDRSPARGESIRILIHDHVREDTHQLYGFMTEGERRMFVMLMGVSGIGPKLALSALSGLSVRDLINSVVNSDVKRLSSISGIGRKIAERIVVDLRDRLSEGDVLEATGGEQSATDGVNVRDAVMALIALGYKQAVARKMVGDALRETAPSDATVEDIVKKALGGEG